MNRKKLYKRRHLEYFSSLHKKLTKCENRNENVFYFISHLRFCFCSTKRAFDELTNCWFTVVGIGPLITSPVIDSVNPIATPLIAKIDGEAPASTMHAEHVKQFYVPQIVSYHLPANHIVSSYSLPAPVVSLLSFESCTFLQTDISHCIQNRVLNMK